MDGETKNFIDEMDSFTEVYSEMKKIGQNYIVSKQLEARLLADWMYKFGVKIEELVKNSVQLRNH